MINSSRLEAMESRVNVVSVKQIMRKASRSQARIACDLGEALAHQDIIVHYQPQFDLRSGYACGVEALARWRRHDGEQMPPSVFIPVAERFGLINAIGVSVLFQACSTIAAWGERHAGLALSVNLSVRQINEDFAELVANIIELSGFPAHRLELEVTESALMTNPDLAVRTLNRCKAIGVQIALDDFGTGYSSLNHLAQLPIDRLKLDRSFVQRMTTESKTAAIVRSVMNLGCDLGLTVIAEGIETEHELGMLNAAGCAQGQGNLFARPMPADQAHQVLLQPWGERHESAGSHAGGGDLHAA